MTREILIPELSPKPLERMIETYLADFSSGDKRAEAKREKKKNWKKFVKITKNMVKEHPLPGQEEVTESRHVKVAGGEVYFERHKVKAGPGCTDIFSTIMALPYMCEEPTMLFDVKQSILRSGDVKDQKVEISNNQGHPASPMEISECLGAAEYMALKLTVDPFRGQE